MPGELQKIENILSEIEGRIKNKKPFDIILVNKRVNDKDKLIGLKAAELKKIKIVLLGIKEETGVHYEIPLKDSLEAHLVRGDKLALKLEIPEGKYYVVQPIEFSHLEEDISTGFSFLLKSFKVLTQLN